MMFNSIEYNVNWDFYIAISHHDHGELYNLYTITLVNFPI
ncbi:conserved hypothetical protein [Xenorhabdus nematophila F1]|uniref:Uncharacterized protein n=1 Tax=Xenorhabdus nematophila (strain ATCC 19061 / DSM 3370 / CCUG 14189 / LMG 1036 / NCIMB 9965 / AN6) TaxID=406817 RepID=D3VD62_XENNA|nr:hypothetical protein XNC1_1868 [Xenorhabdus nematophila ATCC 19061]CCW30018.1 conserved hypothetical protein [Xenorhabdus nematophila F1]CEE93144.1 hypothetical protein XNA1_3430007 [Xenorhabdus nematophila str. Anatoliense]CEF31947.1 hypothetical protein XNW1_4170009 [Xenorhabdus nematophila str. Websteri]CEK22807.1 hypothetical protein XNC2_1813 [Xenorhabdus nematophila AN6/1]